MRPRMSSSKLARTSKPLLTTGVPANVNDRSSPIEWTLRFGFMNAGGPHEAILSGNAVLHFPALVGATGKLAALPYRPMSILPMGAVELASLDPHTPTLPFCSPTNHRLRPLLWLLCPPPGASTSGIVVGGKGRNLQKLNIPTCSSHIGGR